LFELFGYVLVLKDIVTDMTAYASEELRLSGVKAVNVHAGMLNAARNIRHRLIGKAEFISLVKVWFGFL